MSLLEQHAFSVERCGQMVTQAVAREAALIEDDHAVSQLPVQLGLEGGPAEQQQQDRRSQPTLRRNLQVGQRKPTRDPVKQAEASCNAGNMEMT